MYRIFNTLSAFIRQFCLPNPYAMYFETSAYADVFNILVGGVILHVFSFFLTSSVYEKGKHPSWIGSALYCISYIFNTFLIQYLCNNFSTLEIQYIILNTFAINIITYILIRKIKEKILYNIFFV